MKIEEFFVYLASDIDSNREAFIRNMEHNNVKDKSFCDWIGTFSAWMEWNEGDCEQNHIGYEEDEK